MDERGRELSGDWVATFTALLAKAQEIHFMADDLYRSDPDYRGLKDAMRRLRGLRYSADDEDELAALESRAFRLLATLRRVNDGLAKNTIDALLDSGMDRLDKALAGFCGGRLAKSDRQAIKDAARAEVADAEKRNKRSV